MHGGIDLSLINCRECHRQISTLARACPHCGCPAAALEEPLGFNALNSEIAKQREFRVVKELGELAVIEETLSSYIKNVLNVDIGKATLTNCRIVFCGNTGKWMMLAALPVLAIIMTKAYPKIHLQVLLENILHTEIKKHGFSKKLVIHTKQGKSYSLGLRTNDLLAWQEQLKQAGIPVEA